MTNGKPVHVLLVEDDEIDIRAIKRGFSRNHIVNPITEARDGIEALEILRGENGQSPMPRPYIVLLDLNMPRMNGLEFLEEIRKDPKLHDTIVFVLTTSDDDLDIFSAYQKHISGYLLKSKVGEDFVHLVGMLKHFVIMVQLPPHD
jgi:CheY-like chemotaxis protein